MRHNLGFKSVSMESSLSAFDRFSASKGLEEVTIPQALAQEWCCRRGGEANDTWSHRVNFLRQFSVYLHNLGFETYIPLKMPSSERSGFVPYIYTDDEISAIFKAADNLRLYDRHMNTNLFIMPVLVRILFATGIRIGEAIRLKMEDVNMESGYFILRDCKNGKDRIIPFSDSLSVVLHQYFKYRDKLPRKNEYVLIKPDGEPCCKYRFSYYWWNQILFVSGIQRRGKIAGPRIQDARHSFCIKSMRRLAANGKDLYYSLPVLSTYMGHTSVASTDRYVRMTSEMYPELLGKIDSVCSYIFPEIKSR